MPDLGADTGRIPRSVPVAGLPLARGSEEEVALRIAAWLVGMGAARDARRAGPAGPEALRPRPASLRLAAA